MAGATVAEAYDDGGVDAATVALGDVLDVGVDGAVELDAEAWADAGRAGRRRSPCRPPRRSASWPSGTVHARPDQVGAYMGYDGTDEGDVARAERQAAFWQAWLGGGGRRRGEAAPAKPATSARFVEGIARGASLEVLPVVESDAGGETLEADPGPAAELIAAAVPYPLSPAPGAPGAGPPAQRHRRARASRPRWRRNSCAAGAEITIAGNAVILRRHGDDVHL